MGLTLKLFRERLGDDHYVNESRAMATVTRSDMSSFEKMQARRAIDEHFIADAAPPVRKRAPAPSQSLLPASSWRGGAKPGPKPRAPQAPPPRVPHASRAHVAAPLPTETSQPATPAPAAKKRGRPPTGRPVGRPRTRPIAPPAPAPPHRPDPTAAMAVKDCAAAVASLLAELREVRDADVATNEAWLTIVQAAARLATRAADVGAGPSPAKERAAVLAPPARLVEETEYHDDDDDTPERASIRDVFDPEEGEEAAS